MARDYLVVPARFIIENGETKKKKSKDTGKAISYSVDINPSTISYNMGFSYRPKEDTGAGMLSDEEREKKIRENSDRKSVSMELIFDAVDMYDMAHDSILSTIGTAANSIAQMVKMNKQVNGMLNEENQIKFQNSNDIDVTNPKCTNYSKILEAAKEGWPVVFYWGSILIPGKITHFSTRFTYFSRVGNPLRAEVSITVQKQYNNANQKVNQEAQKEKARQDAENNAAAEDGVISVM